MCLHVSVHYPPSVVVANRRPVHTADSEYSFFPSLVEYLKLYLVSYNLVNGHFYLVFKKHLFFLLGQASSLVYPSSFVMETH